MASLAFRVASLAFQVQGAYPCLAVGPYPREENLVLDTHLDAYRSVVPSPWEACRKEASWAFVDSDLNPGVPLSVAVD